MTESFTFTGSEKERAVFEYAITRDFAPKDSDEENNNDVEEIEGPSEEEEEGVETEEPGENGNETTDVEEETPVTIPPLSIRVTASTVTNIFV